MESTLVATTAEGFGPDAAWRATAPGFLSDWREALARVDHACPSRLGPRTVGAPITDHRSSWVRRCRIGQREIYCKTYGYPALRDRLRGALRNTWLAPSRAAREAAALRWLAEAGFEGPRALGYAETRRLGFLRCAVLATEAWPSQALHEVWPSLAPARRTELLAAVWRFVDALHARGFVDRNLDPRNLLVAGQGDAAFRIAKIDSPRHRILPSSRRLARLVAEDRARLERGLARLAGAG
ncbi:MAG: hypothetical protein IT457_04710 [Planctomycetes bacterium]|nr:hypothetical protein [Planctomycetota bacterium]